MYIPFFTDRWKRLINNIKKLYRKQFQGQHQLTSSTKINRYPEIFEDTKQYFEEQKVNPKILSYGCSTGEECFSLVSYFPKAKVKGLDINKVNLKIARQKNAHNNIEYIFSNAKNLKQQKPVDLIFCMSVLCRWEDTKDKANSSDIYPFSKFESTLMELDEVLEKGGLLVIYNSNYRFSDTGLYSRYKPLKTYANNGFVHLFDKNGDRLTENYGEVIFRKEI